LFLSSIAFAECSWYLFEKPMMKIKNKFQYGNKADELNITAHLQ